MVKQLTNMGHDVTLLHDVKRVADGDIAFFLSCTQIVSKEIRDRNQHNLVVHESDLPKGRGWSPLTWQILEGKNEIPITLFEAEETVDSGRLYLQKIMYFAGDELIEDLRKTQADTTIELCVEFVRDYAQVVANATEQTGKPTYYDRRSPKNSRLDPNKSIADQFNLLRTVDNEVYPAFFELNGTKYTLKITKMDD
jgi:methionyl-tRNA formyltransferase